MDFLRVMWALDHRLQSHSKRMKARMGVTGPQRLVLRLVALRPGVSPSELAEVLHFHKSTVTVVLRSLEQAGLVKRAPNRRDGRSISVRLTPKGLAIARRTAGTVEGVVRRVLRKTASSRVRAARRVLEALAAAFNRGKAKSLQ